MEHEVIYEPIGAGVPLSLGAPVPIRVILKRVVRDLGLPEAPTEKPQPTQGNSRQMEFYLGGKAS